MVKRAVLRGVMPAPRTEAIEADAHRKRRLSGRPKRDGRRPVKVDRERETSERVRSPHPDRARCQDCRQTMATVINSLTGKPWERCFSCEEKRRGPEWWRPRKKRRAR